MYYSKKIHVYNWMSVFVHQFQFVWKKKEKKNTCAIKKGTITTVLRYVGNTCKIISISFSRKRYRKCKIPAISPDVSKNSEPVKF